jgi:uncharacterized protein (DUF2147 family)
MATIYKNLYFILAFFLFSMATTQAQTAIDGKDLTGKWRTTDDKTGKVKSIVQIYKEDNKYFGKIVQIFREPSEDQDPVCKSCQDYRKNQRVIGLVIIRNMEQARKSYGSGDILDPETGDIYTCEIWLESKDVLKVRGYWGFFYRTQTWQRVE